AGREEADDLDALLEGLPDNRRRSVSIIRVQDPRVELLRDEGIPELTQLLLRVEARIEECDRRGPHLLNDRLGSRVELLVVGRRRCDGEERHPYRLTCGRMLRGGRAAGGGRDA